MAVLARKKGKSSSNLLVTQFSGWLGGFVIKQYKDKVVLSMPPGKRHKKKTTALQKQRQEKMKAAVFFARHVNDDPVKKAAWKKLAKGYSNVYQAVISWYMKNGDNFSLLPPSVAKIIKGPIKKKKS